MDFEEGHRLAVSSPQRVLRTRTHLLKLKVIGTSVVGDSDDDELVAEAFAEVAEEVTDEDCDDEAVLSDVRPSTDVMSRESARRVRLWRRVRGVYMAERRREGSAMK